MASIRGYARELSSWFKDLPASKLEGRHKVLNYKFEYDGYPLSKVGFHPNKHVPFMGGGEAMTEVIAGRIDFSSGRSGWLPRMSEMESSRLWR